VNSFATLDGDYAAILESFYLPGARTWLVGPLSLASAGEMRDDADEDPEGCLPWLNERAARPGSMVYVSFGTQVDVTVAQLDELAHGLADSGHAFGEDISALRNPNALVTLDASVLPIASFVIASPPQAMPSSASITQQDTSVPPQLHHHVCMKARLRAVVLRSYNKRCMLSSLN
jgi:hypothetical protein